MRKIKKTNNIVKVFYTIFGVLPLLVTLYMYPLIPDKIPVHYWLDGSIDKWGDKHELLIVSIIILLFVCFKSKIFNENFNDETEDKITKFNNYYFILILNLLSYITLYVSINFETCLNNFNLYNFFICTICFIFGFFGNYITHANRNSCLSIRTKYTLENTIIWDRTHKFCGALWLSGSFVFFPMFLFSNGYILLIFAFLMIVVFAILPYIYMHYLHEKYLSGELEEKVHPKKAQHSH
ncbi:SdpI family protein [Terrisporobacter sp.]